ncbi:MAG: type II toxin-antitoxin system HicA family toxin [Anaerolineales bacterium]|nr:type II toxin-antitoxin system HicA family toxin [Anaerolineales bacterium]MBX3036257.1 type II toxin-antitoxin system HicA family toxin [Anaerolineales bacterium]
MSNWKSIKAKRLLAALEKIGWRVKRQTGSHKILERKGWQDVVFAFHDGVEVGPKMLARIAKVTGLKPEDL